MEMICKKPTYTFKRLGVFPKQLLSSTDRIILTLAFTDTGNRIFIQTPYYILRLYTERFRNHSGTSSQF